MLALLKLLDARLSEPSTYAGISAVLLAINVNVDPGIMHMVTLYGTIASGALSILLGEIGNKPPMQVAIDVIEALSAGLKTLPPEAIAPVVVATPVPAVPVVVATPTI